MEKEVLIVILLFIIILIMVVSAIIVRKTRNPKTRGQKIVHKVFKYIFWITFIMLEPILGSICLLIKFFKTDIGFSVLCLLCDIFGGSSSSSVSYYESKQKKTTETENTREYEKRYYHYNEDYTSSIYDNDTVIRSDGVSGYRSGDFVYYNDDSMGHILDEDSGIIEKWQ